MNHHRRGFGGGTTSRKVGSDFLVLRKARRIIPQEEAATRLKAILAEKGKLRA